MNITSVIHLVEPPLVHAERRATSRFPLSEDVIYKLRLAKGTTAPAAGKCVNIGSGGVLFTTESPLPVGRTVELSVNWPALLDGRCPLKFIVSGPVVRSEESRAAIRIDHYEFRTRGSKAPPAGSLSFASKSIS